MDEALAPLSTFLNLNSTIFKLGSLCKGSLKLVTFGSDAFSNKVTVLAQVLYQMGA